MHRHIPFAPSSGYMTQDFGWGDLRQQKLSTLSLHGRMCRIFKARSLVFPSCFDDQLDPLTYLVMAHHRGKCYSEEPSTCKLWLFRDLGLASKFGAHVHLSRFLFEMFG
ncbi:hypothetical protein KC19_1G254000 [Ceratodon purpureus]|uniref:Uncharacterized protein n=1 Tax=Ceratodon purpureus TaxID=3225 RepID=A0A8T0JAC7_CERPU|nr:hypothetical protein KC19_1G254000 [Ceratodon purpureus]